MNLNPITALSGQLQKLINEHGSASILRDHLAMFKDQVTIIEKKIVSLENENKILQTNLNQANSEIENLKNLNQELQRTTHQTEKNLSNVTEQILQQFFKIGQELPMQYFVTCLSLGFSIVQYHFDILLENNHIELAQYGYSTVSLIDARSGGDSSTPDTFKITPKGRKYIVENNLI